jgi:hypothetical protein
MPTVSMPGDCTDVAQHLLKNGATLFTLASVIVVHLEHRNTVQLESEIHIMWD